MSQNWDVTKAIEHAQSSTNGKKSVGMCAKFTRQSIEAGGVTLMRHNSAKDYGTSLTAVGFEELNFTPANGYSKGDVAVIQGFTGHPHGHMQIYDGTQWISDFQQNGFWPGSAYRTNQPAFAIYRHKKLKVQAPDSSSAFGWQSTPEYSQEFCR